ncbi:MAG: hypothetical protein JOZ60_13800 [Verrucomicrobia bacterium]|nr:hypothetical protein [Verrucomicrobiota bacterium]
MAQALNAVSNQTRSLIHQAQLRYIFQGGLDDFEKCFIDSTRWKPTASGPLTRAFWLD